MAGVSTASRRRSCKQGGRGEGVTTTGDGQAAAATPCCMCPLCVCCLCASVPLYLQHTCLCTQDRKGDYGADMHANSCAHTCVCCLPPPSLCAQDRKGDYGAVRKAIEDILDVEGYDDGSYGPLLVSVDIGSSEEG
jgi:hypothetical protein